MKRHAFFISDRTAITAQALGQSLLSQFDGVDWERRTLPFVDTVTKARETAELIDRTARSTDARPIVFCTLVHPELREALAACNGVIFDLFEAFIGPLEAELGLHSTHTVGRSHGMADQAGYQSRIDAVNYALSHDDGGGTTGYGQAEIILVGVSRSGKTPTSLYLALQHGIYAANYPLTEEDLAQPQLPAVLRPYRGKLYGLSIDPQRLHRIRSERRPDSRYASLKQCRLEVGQVEALFRRERIPILDTTSISIEEIATVVVQEAGLQRRR